MMVWSDDYCLGSRIVCEVGRSKLEVCDMFEDRDYWVLLLTNDARCALKLIDFFSSKKWAGIRGLIDLVIRDLGMLRGTHASKKRFIRRLRKLIYVLDSVFVDVGIGWASLNSLLELNRLRKYVIILEAFEDNVHRIRDRVHALVYPHLRRELERIQRVEVWFTKDDWYYRRVAINVDFGDGVAYLMVKDTANYLTLKEVRGILKKIIEREERHKRYEEVGLSLIHI